MQPENPGPLHNGKPRRMPSLAPRCGALTLAGHPCRAWAMANGRCRMHGGSTIGTGPRSAEGLARVRAALTRHGRCDVEHRRFFAQTNAFLARSRALLIGLRNNTLPNDATLLAALLQAPPALLRAVVEGRTPCNVACLIPKPARPGASQPPPAQRSEPAAVVSLAEKRGRR